MARALLIRRAAAVAGTAVLAFGLGLAGARLWLRPPQPLPVTRIDAPSGAGARTPRLAARPEGGLVLSWVEPVAGGYALKFAERVDARWSAAIEVARGADWFVNWIDTPSVVPIDEHFWVAHWLARGGSGGRYDYDIALAVSVDGGRTWRTGLRPHASAAAAEYGFVSIFPEADGAAGIVWLDGRNDVPAPQRSGGFALRFTRVHRDGRVEADRVIDGDVCTCCQTAAAVTDEGPAVAYRGRTQAEVRDNFFVRRTADGWSEPRPLGAEGWTIAACPTNGPALAALGKRLAAAWFTAAGGTPRVRAAVALEDVSDPAAPLDVDADAPIGRVDALWLDAQFALVSWIGAPRAATRMAPLNLAAIDARGALRARWTLAQVAANRDSGMPRIGRDGGQIVVVWTAPAPGYGLRLAAVGGADISALAGR